MRREQIDELHALVLSAWGELPVPDAELVRIEVDECPTRLGPSVRIAGRRFDDVDLEAPEIECESPITALSSNHSVYYLGSYLLHALKTDLAGEGHVNLSEPTGDLFCWIIYPSGFDAAKKVMSLETLSAVRMFCAAVSGEWERFADNQFSEFTRKKFEEIANAH